MSVGFVAFHYPTAEHFDQFVERTHHVREVLRTHPGYESADVWATPDQDAVITVARFETAEQLHIAMTDHRLAEIGAYDDRERAPRKIIDLVAR